jgi:hypothetical protein
VRSSGKPSIVVLADGTLVNVGGSSDATRAAAEAMAKSLARVN